MRNISFSLTTDQFLCGQKDVTRRLGWQFLKPGDRLCAVRKSQGLRKGEKIDRLGVIEVVSVGREELSIISSGEVEREGFPHMSRLDFVEMFCTHMGCRPSTIVTRIEFRRVEGGAA